MAKLRNRILKAMSKANMGNRTFELTKEWYSCLKRRALELQRQNVNVSIVSIILDLIENGR